ncbi:MAG TPA: M20/M25/M40 family metallo-hydrolase [Gemmatimonadales bacterium]|nr:M20/M25/M40 family metallo-hydrolase [Gemmatimonadales bacterium]
MSGGGVIPALKGGLGAAGRRVVKDALVATALLLVIATGPQQASAQDITVQHAAAILKQLVETYGVSGDEARVRAVVRSHLPAWAHAETDTAGNLWVSVGQGDPVTVFVAHMDEIGYRVDSIRADGTLVLSRRGGMLTWLWEGSAALVQTDTGQVSGVFVPRPADAKPVRGAPEPMLIDLGTGSAAATAALGVRVGDEVTNPKKFVPLAGTRATGRSFDDRVGDTSQLLALEGLDPSRLTHRVIFLWVTREEIGLEGSAAAANALQLTPARVYAIDTFVSSDAPLDVKTFADQPIGAGPVARIVDNSSVTPPADLDTLRALAARNGIPLQIGTTNGGNDGSSFQGYGVVDVPIGWPLRYSHSPAEVIDLRDVVQLSRLIRVLALQW